VTVNPKDLARNKAIIQSMTPKERRNPDIIKAGQKKRIAMGSGTSIQEVNTLLKQFYQSKEMMKQFSGKKKGKLPLF
jgi:signal recognition particle subunit SRP54